MLINSDSIHSDPSCGLHDISILVDRSIRQPSLLSHDHGTIDRIGSTRRPKFGKKINLFRRRCFQVFLFFLILFDLNQCIVIFFMIGSKHSIYNIWTVVEIKLSYFKAFLYFLSSFMICYYAMGFILSSRCLFSSCL